MSRFLDIIALAKRQRRRIILPESHDERIVEAARIIRDEGIADVLLIGDKSGSELEREFSENLIDPSGYQNLSELVNVFLGSQKSRDRLKQSSYLAVQKTRGYFI